MRNKKRILLIGGGSGGHIMPNLAIATALRGHCGPNCRPHGGPDCGPNGDSHCRVDILYVGSRALLDRQLVEKAGLPFKAIFTGKLRRYFAWRNFVDPLFVLVGFCQSLWILIRFWPHAVFTKGGFVSLPVALAAFLLRRPIILHESDRVMGLSNLLVARLATKVCVGFPDVTVSSKKMVFTGNPIRLSIQNGRSATGYQITGFRPERPVVLVWGGSQGAQEINEMVEQSFHHLKSAFQIIHVTGHNKQTQIHDPSYFQCEYLGDDLPSIYAITDLVVGRAGANSLYELALTQKPNILIPLKSAAHNHQQLNAEYFEQTGASLILRGEPLYELLIALWHNPDQRISMKKVLGRIAKPEAAEKIAELIFSIAV